MMKEQILLTISILISNRPDTVEKCLQSLDSLRKKVSCELILTDTGCGEKVRTIIEKYADRILEFEWCRDFAKARNLGLENARGKWFLYLDDDEWFEDTKEIEDFFDSGLYKKYGAVLYLQRNYGNTKGTVYTDATVSRMVRLDEGVRFQYSIHETFQNTSGPVKLLRSYVHHYGYIYKNRYERYKHSQRNIIPLLEEHEKAPYNLRHNAQLAQEYNGIGEDLKSIEISLKGIEDFRAGESSIGHLNSLFVNVLERYMHMYQYENVISYALQYIEDDRLNRLGMAKISMLVEKAAYELEQYDRCAKYCDVYLEIYEDYRKNEDWYIGQARLFFNNCFDERMLYEAVCYGISAKIKLKDFVGAKKIFKYINLDSKVLAIDVVLLKNVVASYVSEKLTEEHPCVCIMNGLLEREQLHDKIIEFFEEMRKDNIDMASQNAYKWNYLYEDCWYVSFLKLGMQGEDKWEKECRFSKLWEKPEKILVNSLKLGLWELAEKESVDMGTVIRDVPYYKWKNAVINCCKSMEMKDLFLLNEHITNTCNKDIKKYECWKLYFVKRQLDDVELEMANEQKVIDNLERFSELGISVAQEVYKTEVINSNQEMLPGDVQAAIYLSSVRICIDKEEYLQAIRLLRKITDLLPSIANSLKIYIKKLEKKIKEKENEMQSVKAEMEQLKQAVKREIQVMLQNGEYMTALQLIGQLEAIVGNDLELDAWRQLCNEI